MLFFCIPTEEGEDDLCLELQIDSYIQVDGYDEEEAGSVTLTVSEI